MKQAAIEGTHQARLGHNFFRTDLAKLFLVALLAFLTLVALPHSIRSQDSEPDVATGRGVSPETQSSLGLVTVNGGCSGTLLNQFWVLTARHCVTVDNKFSTALQSPNQVRITAAWTGQIGTASRIYDFDINTAAGSARDRDIVLVYLGRTNLGEAGSQRIFVTSRDGKISGRLKTTDTVTQYGIGFSTFATSLTNPSSGLGTYRSATFSPSTINATHYDLNMNASNQSGHGGDSGGPTVVTIYGQPNGGIAGVQSTCRATGYIPGAPKNDWSWATGISNCTYVSTEPFLSEIQRVIKEAPPTPPFIVAGYPIIPLSFSPTGSVYMEWDGGPSHPNAEVWVSIDNSPDIPAFSALQNGVYKLAKAGPAELNLPRRRYYKFALKDAGTTLSSVAFAIP